MKEQRTFHALRAHIDEMLSKGAVIVGRDPLRLKVDGNLFHVVHGMLISQLAARS